MPVVAREPGTRSPGVFRMVHDGEALDPIAGCLAVIPAPPRRFAISSLGSDSALRVGEETPIERRYLRYHPQREERVFGLLDRDVLPRRYGQIRIHPPQAVIGR